MVNVADIIASEHVQVMTRDPNYFLNNMTNYGALFLGARTMSHMATRSSAPTALLTRRRRAIRAAWWVGKFLKTCTYQRVSPTKPAP